MAQNIFKIKYEDTTRRMSVPRYSLQQGGFNYSELEKIVRDFFEVPCASRVIITYVDTEGDVVTMGSDQDLHDACLTQQLNPLKLEVKVVSTQPLQAGSEATIKESTTLPFDSTEFDVGGLLKGLFPESLAKAIEQILSSYPPSLFTTVPAHALPEALDTFLKTLTGYREDSDMPAVTSLAEGGHLEVVPKQVVHKRITCDCCDVCPIVGPRYKSTKKDDYDLCSTCFLEVRNATDYITLDRPKESEIHSRVPSFSVKPVKIIEKLSQPTSLCVNSWPMKAPIVEKNGVKDDKGSKRLDSEEIESNSCLKERVVNSPAPLVDFPTLAGSHGQTDCLPLAANELVKECVKDETFSSAEGFELVDSPPSGLASEELGFERYDANTEPLQRSCFKEDSLASAGWDYMLKELEEMGFHNTRTNEDLLLKD